MNRERLYRQALESNIVDAKRCGLIIRNLLRFAGNGTNERVLLDVNDATHRAIATLREPEGRLDLSLSRMPLWIEANPVEIEQVILNLISNAFQAGTDIVKVSTRVEGAQAIVVVRDRGHGISEEDRVRLFDPFFTTRLSEGGTGLGLSIVHSLVVEHGGTVEVESEPGKETSFSIMFPLSAGGG